MVEVVWAPVSATCNVSGSGHTADQRLFGWGCDDDDESKSHIACNNRMVVIPSGERCSSRLGLFGPACGLTAIALCVYCGEPFCDQHGERHSDYADVCSRRRCRAKYFDVHAHHESIEQRRGANRVAVCAHEGCQERLRHRCARCLLDFCAEHISERDVSNPDGSVRGKIRMVICDHCHDRRKLWS